MLLMNQNMYTVWCNVTVFCLAVDLVSILIIVKKNNAKHIKINTINYNEAKKYKTANGAIRDILQSVSKCSLVPKYLNVYTVPEQI